MRKLGWIPDLRDPRDVNVDVMGLASSSLPSEVTLRDHALAVLDQGSTQSCVAQAFAQAVLIHERTRGLVSVLPSRRFIYYNSRRLSSGTFVTFDNGTYLRTAAQALSRLGAPDERVFPFRTGWLDINRRPSFDAYLLGYGRRGGVYRRIFEEGYARTLAIKAALAAGYPVAFGTPISKAFTGNFGPPVVDPPTECEIIGGHAMLFVGYQDTAGGTLFEVINSWGAEWRNRGFFRMTEEWVSWSRLTDLWVVGGWHAVQP